MPIYNTPTPTPTPPPMAINDQIFLFLLNYVLPILLVVLVLIFIAIIIKKFVKKRFVARKNELLFKDFNIGEYKIVFMRKIGGKYIEIDRIKMKINETEEKKFRYNNKDFSQFDKNKLAWSDKNNNYYAFDYDSGEQLSFSTKGLPDKISIDMLDIYVNRHVIADLVQGLETPKTKGQWVMLIVGIAIGVGIGFIIGQQVTQSQMK